MNYLLYGSEDFQINNRLDELIKKYKINEMNIVNYTLDNNIKEIIDDASTVSLFDDKKIIIVNQANIFDSKLNNLDYLENYFNNPNPDTILIMILNSDKVDTRRKIFKALDKKGIIEEYNKKINIFKYVSDMFQGYTITKPTIQLLIKRVGNKPEILKQEVNKLLIYKDTNKIITDDDIISVCSHYIDINIFKFMDDIINKNKKEAIITYHELLKIGEEPIKIVIMLANNYRLMYQATNLRNLGYTEKDIMKITGKSLYPIKLAIQKGLKYTNDQLINTIDSLANLDYQMKTSDVDKKLALELFILKL